MVHSASPNTSWPRMEATKPLHSWLKWGLKLSFTAGLIVAVATIVGWREIQYALLDVDMKLVGIAWLLGLASRCGEATQLSLIMRRAGLAIRAGQVLVASSLSTLYGLVLPGDLAASVAKWAYQPSLCGNRWWSPISVPSS